MRDMAHSICLIKLCQITIRKNFDFLFLTTLRRIFEVPKSTPVAAMYLELDVLPVQFEIEKKQLMSLKHLLEKMKMTLL